MHHPVAVGVVDDLGDVGDELQLVFEGQGILVLGQPQIQRGVALGLGEGQADAQLRLVDQILGDLQAVVAQPRQQMELAGDRLLSGLAVGGRGGLAHGVEAQDPAVVLELDQIQGVAGQDQQVHLMPAAPVVAELEVGPGSERGCVG